MELPETDVLKTTLAVIGGAAVVLFAVSAFLANEILDGDGLRFGSF